MLHRARLDPLVGRNCLSNKVYRRVPRA
jgi:hypothetical protein